MIYIVYISFSYVFSSADDSGVGTQYATQVEGPQSSPLFDDDMPPPGQRSPLASPVLENPRKRTRPEENLNIGMQSGPGADVATNAADAAVGVPSHAAGTDSQFGPEPYMPKTCTKWIDNDTIEFKTTHIVYQQNFNSKWLDVSSWVQPYPKASNYKPLAKAFPLFDLEWDQMKRYIPRSMFRKLQTIGSGKFTKCGVSVKLCSISQVFETNAYQTEKVQQGKMRYIGVCKGPELLHNTFNSCNVSIDGDSRMVMDIQLPIVDDDSFYLWADTDANGDRLDDAGAAQMGQPQQYPNYLTAIRQVKNEPLYNYMSAIDMFNANNVIMSTYIDEEYEFKDSRTGPFKPKITDNAPRDH